MVATLALLGAAPGARLLAQGAPESTAEYRQLVERLAERWQHLREEDSLLQAGPEGEGGPRLDTLRFGMLTLSVPPQGASLAAAIGSAAWDSIAAAFGSDTAALLPQSIAAGGRRGGRALPLLEAGSPREDQESYGISMILGYVRRAESSRFRSDSGVEGWVAPSLRAMLFASDSIQRAATYMELATNPWAVVRACFGGDLEACGRALSHPSNADSMALLFTPAERRRLVAQQASSHLDLSRAPGTTRCVEAGVDSACVDLFRRFPNTLYEEPLSDEARATLLRTAADLGGEGWYRRLLSSSGQDYLERLSQVAEMPPQRVLEAWRTRILRARPDPMTLSRISGWVAFLWAAAFAVMATRSSRWRRD